MHATAVIAAAGLSSRMGAFKPLMRLGGQTFIERAVRSMAEAGIENIIVVAGFRGSEVMAALRTLPARVVINERYAQSEMFDSLKTGLSALEDPGKSVFLMPGDCPLIRPETVRRLAAHDGRAVRPCYRGTPGHPLMVDSALIPDLLAYPGGEGLRGAVRALGLKVEDLSVEDPGCVLDADTPEDVIRLERILSMEREP